MSALQQQLCSPPTLNALIRTLLNTPRASPIINRIAQNIALRTYVCEFNLLLSPSVGFHFNVAHAKPSQFSDFSSMKMAHTFEELCLNVWKLFGALPNVVAIQKETTLVNGRGDYLTEITYRHQADRFLLPMPELSAADAMSDMDVEMPDKSWGMYVDDDLLVDERRALESTEGGDRYNNVWSTHTGARWQKLQGRALQKPVERTHVEQVGWVNTKSSSQSSLFITTLLCVLISKYATR
ncbi:hypothetical protein FRC12_021152 [Ceratobasidium sp. 428]|nr:hypothetical protein FRC12_021152 [Ceratobasidium sp. 428]